MAAMVNASDDFGERSGMANSKICTRRVVVAGALAVAALAVPALATSGHSDAPMNSATGKCLAWFGSRGDGICMGYSTGNGINVGTPDVGIYGPGYGFGVSTGPLLPLSLIHI